MGSGCNPNLSSSTMRPVPDTSVIYTGPPIPLFGICTGDTLLEIEAVILGKIVDFSSGIGINIPDIDLTTCDCFKSKVTCCANACQSLICILQAYLDCMCELYADVQILKAEVKDILGPYNTSCLVGVTSTSLFSQIFQEVIVELCQAEADITSIKSTIANLSSIITSTVGNWLLTAIQSCQIGSVVKTGSGASVQIKFQGFVPVGGIIMYAGPIAGVFDSSGVGLNPGPACGFALCNGTNGSTIDMRGFKPVGVNDGSMGSGPQSAEVDNAINPGQGYGLNAHGGAIKVSLTSAMCSIPAHTHPVNDLGHSHVLAFGGDTFSGSKFSNMVKFDGNNLLTTLDGVADVGNIHIKIKNNTTGITIGPASGGGSGTGAAHENRDPYKAVYFIQRLF